MSTELDDTTTVKIPKQSYYNMMVYDLDPLEVNSFFAATDVVEDEHMKHLTEMTLDFLNDRVKDGSHSKEDDNLPDTDDIREKIKIVEDWRLKFSSSDVERYLE